MNSPPPRADSHFLPILTAEQTRALEKAAAAGGISYTEMMARAGQALAERVLARLGDVPAASVLFLIGPGNNGGDGLVAARYLRESGPATVNAYLLRARDDDQTRAAREAGVQLIAAEYDEGGAALRQCTLVADVIVDALYGIGLRLPLPGEAVALLRTVREALSERNDDPLQTIEPARPPPLPEPPYLIAADCPSGLDVDSGAKDEDALPASETVTFLVPKRGLFSLTAAAVVGRITVAPLGIPESIVRAQAGLWQLAHAGLARQLLPARGPFSDKHRNGRLLVIAGCERYFGAVALTARAAYRSGAGIVHIACPAVVREQLSSQILEAVWLPLPDRAVLSPACIPAIAEVMPRVDALVIGPGLGLKTETRAFLAELLTLALPPFVLDADGLNLLSQMADGPKRLPPTAVITPHQRELSRLSGFSVDEIGANRWDIAERLAREWGVTLLLKGAYTTIASPEQPTTILPFHLDALATAGTGDILSGVIGAFLAGGSEPKGAAIAAGYLHALAGSIAQDELGSARAVMASDVSVALGAAFAQLEPGWD